MRERAKVKVAVVGENLPPEVLILYQIAIDDAVKDVCEFLEFQISEEIKFDFGR